MKLYKTILSTLIIVSLSIPLIACSSSKEENRNDTTTQTTEKKVETKEQSKDEAKTFTLEELKKYDGKNGNPAYVAIKGTVYDVTQNKNWKNGEHNGFKAGSDLTEAIKGAPHGETVLGKVIVIGKLK